MTLIGIRVTLVAWLIRLTAIIAPYPDRQHFVRAIQPYLEGVRAGWRPATGYSGRNAAQHSMIGFEPATAAFFWSNHCGRHACAHHH